MSRPQQPEIERSGRGEVDQRGRRTAREQDDADTKGGAKRVPPENTPGHHPEREQDKPHAAP